MTLSILTKEQICRHYIVYDLEWIPGSLELRIVGCYDENGYRCYRTIKSFLQHEMTNKNQGKWFYAHFGGGADFQFILAELVNRPEYEVDGCFSGSALIIAHVKRGHHVWHFLDSYWLIRMPLAKIGEWLKMPKTGPDKETEDAREWYANVPERELILYNEQDCRILYNAIKEVENAVLAKGGILQMTLASTAMALFRRKYLKKDIITHDTVNEIARTAYIASRVEVFAQDCDNAYYYDINSSFPYAMTLAQPGMYKKFHRALADELLRDEHPSLIHALVEMPECYLPPIPLRFEQRIIFPYGRWKGWFTNIDLALLLENEGKIIKIYEAMEFEAFYDMADYAHDLYNSRLAATSEAEKVTYKLLLNSLYGKTAESSSKLRLRLNPSEKILAKLSREYMKSPGIWVEPLEAHVPHVHVPIAAQVTAIARRRIYEPMSRINEVYYCDTDGFASSDPLPESAELGALKLEKMVIHGEFVAPKVYSLKASIKNNDGTWEDKEIYKAKGFSLGKGKIAAKRFSDLAAGQEIQIERMRRLRELLNKGKTIPEEVIVNKKLQNEVFPKRYYYPDGDSRPWHTDEIKTLRGNKK